MYSTVLNCWLSVRDPGSMMHEVTTSDSHLHGERNQSALQAAVKLGISSWKMVGFKKAILKGRDRKRVGATWMLNRCFVTNHEMSHQSHIWGALCLVMVAFASEGSGCIDPNQTRTTHNNNNNQDQILKDQEKPKKSHDKPGS